MCKFEVVNKDDDAMRFLKQSGDMVPNDSPKFLLHRLLSDYQDARSLEHVHASELTKEGGICARLYGLVDLTKTAALPTWLTTSQAVTYELGHLLEARIINWYADIGAATTNWQCMACGTITEFSTRPKDCHGCGCTGFKPDNYRFESSKTGISCGIDLLLSLPKKDKLTVLEIKTIAPDEFKALAAPLAEHRLRTNLYLRCIAESAEARAKLVDTTEAFILYVTKGGFGVKDEFIKAWGLHDGFSPFKEFKIKRQDKDTEDLIAPAIKVKHFRQGLIGLPGPICSTALGKRAQDCHLRKACFSGDWPPGTPK